MTNGCRGQTYASFEIDKDCKSTNQEDEKHEQDDDENARPRRDSGQWAFVRAGLEPDGEICSSICNNTLNTDVELQVLHRGHIGNVGVYQNCFLCNWRIVAVRGKATAYCYC